MKVHNLFLSHSWTYKSHYDGLITLLRNKPYFAFRDYSVPKDDPVHTSGSEKELEMAIKRHMLPCGVILVLAGVYATYSKWIKKEIALAQRGFVNRKPIVAIEPWGSERTSTVVKEAADRIVKWNTDSIVEAIRELA